MKMKTDWKYIFYILILSLTTRILFLSFVNQVVFDEVHFGKFVSSYCCTGERFFDIHPPIGKLLIAGGAYLAGYTGNFSFDSIGQSYGDIPIAAMRLVPAFAGTLLSIIIFILLRQIGVSLQFSFLGALAIALDNALIVESRFILTDSILLSATFGAICFAFASIRSNIAWQSWLWAILAGIAGGIAAGTKFTGLVGGALVCVIFVVEIVRGKRVFVSLFLSLLFGCIVYLLGWMLHFSLLTMPGSGDVWGIPTGVFWTDLIHTHQQMVSANYNLTATHPYGSKWYTWPFMIRSVFYWQGQGNQFVYLLGNPMVWWGSFGLFCTGSIVLFFQVASRRGSRVKPGMTRNGAWIFILGYFVSFIPLMRIPRVLFLYHYLTPLIFSLLFGIWWLDRIVPKKKNLVMYTGCFAILAGFIFISPVTYGITLPDVWYSALFSISSWR